MTNPVRLPFDRWPAADQRLWNGLIAKGGLLDDRGPMAHLRSSTLGIYVEQYGRWLAWLARIDEPALKEAPPARASIERFKNWTEAMDHLAPASRAMIARGVLIVLAAAAPNLCWDRHHRLVRELDRLAAATRGARKHGRIFDSGALLDAGLELAGARADSASTRLKTAALRRDGAAIALLALLPIRLRALTELELGTSLLREGREFTIALTAPMTKTGVPWEAEVPDVVAATLARYIDEVRPWFMARGDARHDRVWVTRQGRPFDKDYLSRRVRERTELVLGVRVPPHFFRDSAATTLTRRSPDAARLVRPLLAHSGFETAERHYIHAKGIEAGRNHAALIDRLRKGSR